MSIPFVSVMAARPGHPGQGSSGAGGRRFDFIWTFSCRPLTLRSSASQRRGSMQRAPVPAVSGLAASGPTAPVRGVSVPPAAARPAPAPGATVATSLPSRARVVIIGGGVIGASVAYHLAGLGWTDVLLLEQGKLSCGSTWPAAGLVGQL